MLQIKSRKVRILGFITLLVLVGLNILGQHYIDSTNWFLQGYGWVIWLPIAFNFLKISFEAAFTPGPSDGMIDLNQAYQLAIQDKEIAIARRFARIIAIAKEICTNANEDYNKIHFLVNVADDDKKNKKQSKNAGSLGTSANGVVILNLSVITDSSDAEIAGLIAHELGHAMSADMSISIMLRSFTKFFAGYSFLIFFVLWYFNGFSLACGAWIIWAFVIPYIFSLHDQAREELADSYATALGYGQGLITFFENTIKEYNLSPLVDFLISVYAGSHPSFYARIRYIKNIIAGDQGKVPDGLELGLWSILKLVIIGIVAYFLHGFVWTIPVLLWNIPTIYFAAAVWFYTADSFLTSFNLLSKIGTKSDTKKQSALFSLFALAIFAALYATGIYAAAYVSTMAGLFLLGKIILCMWIVKPATMLLEGKSGFMAVISTLTTYASIIASVLIIISLFIPLPF